jgi:hypothetical protein
MAQVKDDIWYYNQFKRQFKMEVLKYEPNGENGKYFCVKLINKKTGVDDIYTWDDYCGEAEPKSGIFNRETQDQLFGYFIKWLGRDKVKKFSVHIPYEKKMSVSEQNKLDTFIETI